MQKMYLSIIKVAWKLEAVNVCSFAGRPSKDSVGQISVHVDITATPGTGEHKVTVKGMYHVQKDQIA